MIDDREAFANRERFPEARDVHADEFDHVMAQLVLPEAAFVVIATRGHRDDMRVLRWAANTPAHYVGMIGSKRKVITMFRELEKEGIAPDKLNRVSAPDWNRHRRQNAGRYRRLGGCRTHCRPPQLRSRPAPSAAVTQISAGAAGSRLRSTARRPCGRRRMGTRHTASVRRRSDRPSSSEKCSGPWLPSFFQSLGDTPSLYAHGAGAVRASSGASSLWPLYGNRIWRRSSSTTAGPRPTARRSGRLVRRRWRARRPRADSMQKAAARTPPSGSEAASRVLTYLPVDGHGQFNPTDVLAPCRRIQN